MGQKIIGTFFFRKCKAGFHIHGKACLSISKIQYSTEHRKQLTKAWAGMQYIFHMLFQLTCKHTDLYMHSYMHRMLCKAVEWAEKTLVCFLALWALRCVQQIYKLANESSNHTNLDLYVLKPTVAPSHSFLCYEVNMTSLIVFPWCVQRAYVADALQHSWNHSLEDTEC